MGTFRKFSETFCVARADTRMLKHIIKDPFLWSLKLISFLFSVPKYMYIFVSLVTW